MQTFLPYPDFKKSAAVLDPRRLGKQRVEAFQIMRALTTPTYGWQHHPAVCMWRGYPRALNEYYAAIVEEWIRRGYRNNMPLSLMERDSPTAYPAWLGTTAFHLSHRAALFHKDPEWYGRYWEALPKMNYVWPTDGRSA